MNLKKINEFMNKRMNDSNMSLRERTWVELDRIRDKNKGLMFV